MVADCWVEGMQVWALCPRNKRFKGKRYFVSSKKPSSCLHDAKIMSLSWHVDTPFMTLKEKLLLVVGERKPFRGSHHFERKDSVDQKTKRGS